MYENATKLPPGIVQTDAAEDESSTWLTDLGGRGTGYASWAWLRKKFGTPVDDYYKGHRLYLRVRPFDADSQWLRNLEQEFTADGQKDAERYGFELMRDEPRVQGFWVDAHLDKYWNERGERRDRSMLSRGRYERAQQTLNARRLKLEPGQHLETRPVLGGAYRGRLDARSTLTHAVICDEQGREIRTLCGQNVDHVADYYSISEEGRAGPPSCPRCLERWEKLTMHTTNARRAKKDPTAWRSTPAGETKYREARAEAQALANADGFDRGLEANDLFREWRVFMLPGAQYRSGHELRAEVVSCEDLSKCQRGHGPSADHTPNAAYYVWVLDSHDNPMSEGPYGPHDLEGAKTFARISATQGAHDRAVSRGIDPDSPSFEIVRRYRHGTGERVL